MHRLGDVDEAALRRAILTRQPEGGQEDLRAAVRASTDPGRLLGVLARDRDRDVRLWVSGSAGPILGREAEHILLRLSRDREADVSSDALAALADLGGNLAPAAVRVLRKKLHSKNLWDPVGAIWLIARLRLAELEADLRDIVEHPAEPFYRQEAEIALLVLRGEDDAVIQRLTEHDHEHIKPLSRAAYAIGGDQALRALKTCAATAPDERCSQVCGQVADAMLRDGRVA